MKEKIIKWIKDPENIIILVCFIVFTIIGIIDDDLIYMYKLFVIALLFGLLMRGIFYLKNKFF
jgi:hypothetical protein